MKAADWQQFAAFAELVRTAMSKSPENTENGPNLSLLRPSDTDFARELRPGLQQKQREFLPESIAFRTQKI
jgi:hypothetical protein